MKTIDLCKPIGTTGAQNAVKIDQDQINTKRLYEAMVVGNGAVSATVAIYGSYNGTTFPSIPVGTMTLSGTTAACDNFASYAQWPYIQVNISAISGTGATVTCKLIQVQ